MAGSINKVILVGNLGQDPEIRSFQNGGKIANLRVATSERWKDKNSGEQRERTEWHSIAIHQEGAVEFAGKYLAKGSKVYVEGQLETRKWQDQSGVDRYSTEVVVRPYRGQILSLDKREGGAPSSGRDGGAAGRSSEQAGAGDHQVRRGQPEFDDEIPF